MSNFNYQSALHDLLERAARPGVLGVVGRTLEMRCARELRAYFKVLSRAVAKLHLENYALVSTETQITRHMVTVRMQNVMRINRPLFMAAMESNLKDAYLAAHKMAYAQEARTVDNQPMDKLGASGEAAAAWAQTNAAELVTGVEATTVQDIADAVAQGIEDRLGVGGTGRLIRQIMEDASSYRAKMIASTEMNRAMSQAALDKMNAISIDYKQIVLSYDACDICLDNADQDPIQVDEQYPSGDVAPPFHPNCRCAITGARPPNGEEKE